MNHETKIRAVLFELAVQGNLIDYPSASAEFSWKITDPMSKATQAILSLLNQVRAEERKQVAKLMKQGLDTLPRLEQLIREAKINELELVVDLVKPEYHNVVVGKITELKAEAEL